MASIERDLILEAPPEEIWRAVTDEAMLREWLAPEVDLDPWEGGSVLCRTEDGERQIEGYVLAGNDPGNSLPLHVAAHLRVYRKRGPAVLVKRTQARIASPSFFERYRLTDEFDDVEGIGPQILDKRSLRRDLLGIDPELFDDDVLNLLFD